MLEIDINEGRPDRNPAVDLPFTVHAMEHGQPRIHDRHVDVVPESLTHGDVIFVEAKHFIVNRAGGLFIDSGANLTKAVCQPPIFAVGSIGLTVCFAPDHNGATVREYVADLRHSIPHKLKQTMHGQKISDRPEPARYNEDIDEPHIFLPIGAHIDVDERGNPEYFGPRRLVTAAKSLITAVDNARQVASAGEAYADPGGVLLEKSLNGGVSQSLADTVLRHAMAGDWEAAHEVASRL